MHIYFRWFPSPPSPVTCMIREFRGCLPTEECLTQHPFPSTSENQCSTCGHCLSPLACPEGPIPPANHLVVIGQSSDWALFRVMMLVVIGQSSLGTEGHNGHDARCEVLEQTCAYQGRGVSIQLSLNTFFETSYYCWAYQGMWEGVWVVYSGTSHSTHFLRPAS